ncbi:glycine receptor subunit alpha-2-like [Liolophura sinensis]|uniref:glycine receptor subunit alpha-2-like n=1 Tax=Liolophura sinensis TaxID=3198878 RepID=UPI0031586FA9
MDLTINIYFREKWQDLGLAYSEIYPNVSKITLDRQYHDKIWVPDLFFPNEKGSTRHDVTTPNQMVILYPNGTVFHSARYTIRLACPMNLTRFPLDNQVCSLKIESLSHVIDEMKLVWFERDAIETAPDIVLPQFELYGHNIVNCTSSYISGDFTCLEAKFYLVRRFGFYLVQIYVPSTLIVTLSWVSFWINHDAVPARISLGVLTVLSMTTQSIGLIAMPKVTYITAIDLWIAICVCFVFSSTLEFAFVNTLARRDVRLSFRRGPLSEQNHRDIPSDDTHKMIMIANGRPPPPCRSLSFRRHRSMAKRLDKIARVAFPLTFIIFNVFYWTYYLHISRQAA